jgi:hypothetical protein
MIKSILSGSPVRKFVAYSSAEQDLDSGALALTYKLLNDKYPKFPAIKVEEYSDIVKTVFSHLSQEEQALILEILKGYNSREQYLKGKPSIPLEAAHIEMLRQKIEIQQQKEVQRKTQTVSNFKGVDRRKGDRRGK